MLYLANDAAGPRRVQGCHVSDEEVRRVVQHWKDWYEEQVAAGKMDLVRVGPWQRGAHAPRTACRDRPNVGRSH